MHLHNSWWKRHSQVFQKLLDLWIHDSLDLIIIGKVFLRTCSPVELESVYINIELSLAAPLIVDLDGSLVELATVCACSTDSKGVLSALRWIQVEVESCIHYLVIGVVSSIRRRDRCRHCSHCSLVRELRWLSARVSNTLLD